MKTCTKCQKTQAVDNFYKNTSTTDGKQSHCKVCVKETARLRRRRKGMKPQVAGKGFSTDRHCGVCDTTKDWKQYHMDAGMCADCWRGRLSDMALERTEQPLGRRRKKQTTQHIIDFIDALQGHTATQQD